MVMRYHLGLAIGHTYCHVQHANTADVPTQGPHPTTATSGVGAETEYILEHPGRVQDPDVDDPELSPESHEDSDFWEAEEGSEEDWDSDNEEQVAMYDMYGPSYLESV